MPVRTRTCLTLAAISALTAVAAPSVAAELPDMIDPYGHAYEDPHTEHGGYLLSGPVMYCEAGVPMVALSVVNASSERTGFTLSSHQAGVLAQQQESPARSASLVSTPVDDVGEGSSAELLALETTTMPEVVSYAVVQFTGTCEGKPDSQEAAFDLAATDGGETITQWYQVGDVTEPPATTGGEPMAPRDDAEDQPRDDTPAACCGDEGPVASGPRIQTGRAAGPSGPGGALALGGALLLTAGAAGAAAARRH